MPERANVVALADTPMRSVLSRLKGVKKSGGQFIAPCPAHDDDNPSLSVTEGRDGRVLLNCHAGCTTASIVAALGLEMTALFAPRLTTSQPMPINGAREERLTLTTTYDYVNENGALVFQVCRFIGNGGKKTFRQRRPDGRGGWVYGLGETKPVLYRLPEVMAAIESGRTIHIVEGEKDADALADLGYIATTNPMGAGKWRDSYSELLKGAEVVVFPDNDDTGRAHAEEVAASLSTHNCTVKVVQLPNVPPKGDFSDWLDAGGNLDTLEELIGATRLWSPDSSDPSRRSRYRLDELWSNAAVMRPPPTVVPRIAWSGRLTLLAAREKSGKSTLTGYVTAQVTRGGMFLGQHCTSGNVLVIGLEEFIGDAARRLRHFDADPTRVHVVDKLHGDPQSRPQEVRTHIEAVDPKLVIIDSLSAYSAGQIQDENNAAQMTAVVKPLADLAHELGIAVVVLHHASKASNKARGSTGIMANADVVCEFFAPNEDTDATLRTMRTAGRVPIIPRWDFRYDGRDYSLTDGSDAPIEQQIMTVVAERPTLSINDVCEVVKGRRAEVQSMVQQLLASGQLSNVGTGSHAKLMIAGPRMAI